MTRSDRDHVLIGLVGDGIRRSHSPLLHQREADRQGIRLIYTTIDSQRARPRRRRPARPAPLGPQARIPGAQRHPPVQAGDRPAPRRALGRGAGARRGQHRRLRRRRDAGLQHRRVRFPAAASSRTSPTAPRNRVVQLGAGGAGSAVAHAMLTLGARHLTLVDLDGAKAARLADALAERVRRGAHLGRRSGRPDRPCWRTPKASSTPHRSGWRIIRARPSRHPTCARTCGSRTSCTGRPTPRCCRPPARSGPRRCTAVG